MPLLNATVIMSDARHFAATQAINPYYGSGTPNITLAQQEHESIKQLLESAGVQVITVPSPIDSQDGVYTANWALVRGNKAVLARLPNVRKTEEAYAHSILEELNKEVIEVPNNLRFSGQGDALPFGNYLFCGQGYRSDKAAQAFVADQLGYERIQLETIPFLQGNPSINPVSGWPDSFFYDIDLALSIIRPPLDDRKGLIAYCPEAFTPESNMVLEAFPADKVLIDRDEAIQGFAANLVSTGESVIMSSKAPKLEAALKTHDFTVFTPEITELAKGGGYIRCTTLTLN